MIIFDNYNRSVNWQHWRIDGDISNLTTDCIAQLVCVLHVDPAWQSLDYHRHRSKVISVDDFWPCEPLHFLSGLAYALDSMIIAVGKKCSLTIAQPRNPFHQQHAQVRKSTLIHLPIVHEKNNTVQGNMKALYETFKRYGLAQIWPLYSNRSEDDILDIPVEDDVWELGEDECPSFNLYPLAPAPSRQEFAVVCGDQLSVARVRPSMCGSGWERTHICTGVYVVMLC